MNMSTKERLKKYVKSQGLTISAFEKAINVSNGYINSISKGIGGENLMAIIEKSPNLNINWLLTGEGEMFKRTEKGGISQTISGDNNTMSGNDTYIGNNDKETIKELKERLSEAERKLEEKDQQISKLINVIEKLNSI